MAFVSIHLEGGLFPPDLLEDLAAETLREGQRPEDFGLPAGQSLQAEISEAWGAALQHWKAFQRSLLRHLHGGSAGVSLTTLTRNWVQSFLAELGYELVYQPRAADLDGRSYAISHRAGPDAAAPPVHIVSCELQLDEKPPSGRPRLSAHALVQEYCNRSEHLWGLATNGLRLRVIRDAAHVSHPTYLEFSLQQLFEGELFSEFVLLFRLLHRTRLPATAATASECWLERYYQTGLERGGRARERIREGVEEALRRFGAGFLRHEANEELRAALRTGRLDAAGYYQELLRLVYRLLFLLVAEERGLAGPEDPRLAAIYREHYSVSRLRPLVEQPIGLEEQWHDDLWQSLLVTFQAYTDRAVAEALDMHPLDGELFSHDALRFLERCRLHNADLLAAFHGLSLYREDKGRLRRVNYAHLDVEELGSIYEALLDYTPVVDPDQHAEPFRFVAGTERKSTGSYYTPHELVQELITRALDPVMADRLSGARTPQEQERALLSLRVCDPATGSGHFLLAAARRIARELARVRTGEDEPDAASYRAALRDVVSHCLYGVDVNPLAVELCRVALWIESHDRGKPLTFLDHRIHCGDSLVGVFDLKVLEEGIPDGAYDPVAGDDRALARDLKKRNRQERERQPTLFPSTTPPAEQLAELSKRLAAVAALPERTIQEREAKQQAYQSLRDSQLCRDLTTAADLWTAAFFLPMQKAVLSRFSGSAELGLTTATVWRYLADGSVRGDLVGEAIALARRIRAFHWPLAFPDVFEAGGFDVVLGNPPFKGGLKVSGTLGDRYRHWLEVVFSPYSGTADLCALFYRLAFRLLRPGGRMGMVATNTIGQGDTRESGLAVVLRQGGVITFARRFIKWPGVANVEVNLVAIHKADHSPFAIRHSPILDGQSVDFISSRLDTEPEAEPKRLKQNEGKAFIGDYVRGIGFVLEPEEAEALLAKDPRNGDCLLPYLNGEDLNSHPAQKPSRWVICFHDWDLERARRYPDLLNIVEERVKPEREKLRDGVSGYERLKRRWWNYAAYAQQLRRAIAPLRRVMVRSRVSEMHALAFLPKGWVYNEQTIVFAFDDDYHFALLQSSVHEVWVWRQASSLESRNRYTPTDCFDTFPFPPEEYRRIANGNVGAHGRAPLHHGPFAEAMCIGAQYHEHRQQMMLARNIGLTQTYNLFHDPGCTDADIQRLRELHTEMDRAILACYGWDDLDPQHGFYPNERGQVRFTVSPEARRAILRCLLDLNLGLRDLLAVSDLSAVEVQYERSTT